MNSDSEILEYLKKIADNKPTTEEKPQFDLIREQCRIKPTDTIQPPKIAIEMFVDENPEDSRILGTLGNFSLLIGKAKSKKSFLMGIVTAATFSDLPIFQTFKGCLPPERRNILYFDTEQGKWHVQNAIKRICKVSGIPNPENLFAYGLRSIDTETRLQFIEHEIYSMENLGFVIIDGIRDLAFDINDGKEGSLLAGKLMKWSEEKDIHIITVLHQNKGDNNARGHLGTELVNKAETVLSVEKIENSDVSVVTPKDSRNREVEPFAFAIDENGLPYKARVPESAREGKEKFNPDEVPEDQLEQLFYMAFKMEDFKPIGYSGLKENAKIFSEKSIGKKVGDTLIKNLITRARFEQIILQPDELKKGNSKPNILNSDVREKFETV